MNTGLRGLVVVVLGGVFAWSCSGGSTVTPTLTVLPGRASVELRRTQQFVAVLNGVVDDTAIWSVDEAEGGLVSASGLYTAPATPQQVHVRATSLKAPGRTAYAEVSVTAASTSSGIQVTLSPVTARLKPGEPLQFTAVVVGGQSAQVAFTASGGSISADGLFTAPALPGFVTVTATSAEDSSRVATSTIAVVDQVTVVVTPPSASLRPGDTAQFEAFVTGAPTSRVTWSASGGTVTDGGLFSAPGSEGNYQVTATSIADTTASASALVVVSPVQVHILNTPPITLNAGEAVQFVAQVTGTDQGDVSWSATGGSIDSNGLYVAGTTPGDFSATATSTAAPSRRAQIPITIRDIAVTVSPATALMQVGTSRQFQALVTGARSQAVAWSVVTPGGGSISDAGTYTAPATPGTYAVQATSAVNPQRAGLAQVTVQTAPVVSVSISSPTSTVTVPQGGTQQYTATVGGTTATGVTWSSSGGVISSAGLFTAPAGPTAAGTYTITATSQADGTQTASASVLVPPVTVDVAPATATLVAANSTNATPTSQTFVATVSGAQTRTVTWSVQQGSAGGTIGAGGQYQSPAVPGTYTVVARSTVDPSKQATATVTVLPVPVTVTISPRSATLAPGSIGAFTATLQNATAPGVVWSVADGGVGGRIDPFGNYTAPATVGQDTIVAVSVQDSTRSDQVSVTVCNQGGLCTPANTCKTGTLACSASGVTCTDTGVNAPNGTVCGVDRVCSDGACTPCVSGVACTGGDPCALGVTSCVTGVQRCISGGPNPARPNGSACSPVVPGVCLDGRCECGDAGVFVYGDCQTCPVFTSRAVLVNADPTRGADNRCCGRFATPGLGGPCLTLGQAIDNVQGDNWTISVTPDVVKNLSGAERFPILLKRGVAVALGNGYLKGEAGKPIFVHDPSALAPSVSGGTLGVDSAGVASHASEAARVVGSDAGIGSPLYLGPLTVAGTVNGITVDSAQANLTSVVLRNIENAGLWCRSETVPARRSAVAFTAGGFTSARYGALVSSGCDLTVSGALVGSETSRSVCPLPRGLEHGIWVEGTGSVKVSGGTFSCVNSNGLALRTSPTLPDNAPQAEVYSATFSASGCAGLYAEVGRATVRASRFRDNHFGVHVSSQSSSSDPLAAPVVLTTGPAERNEFLCNRALSGGACSVGPYASRGFSIFNNSGFTINADNNNWAESPVSKCLCDETLSNCSCVGQAYGLTSPPDQLSVLNAPLLAGTTGVPTVTTGNFSLASNLVCQ